jgi:hypothetical protein
MSKRIVLGVFLAVVASAITASAVVVVVGQQGEERTVVESYIPPEKALKPSELTKIPAGTPVADLAKPVDYGRFHILPPGSAPDVYAPSPSPPPGLKRAGEEMNTSDTLGQFRDHGLFIEPPYIPAGWELTWAHAEAVMWDDGSRWDTVFRLQYDRPQYFDIRIARFLLDPDGQVELVAHRAEGDIRFAYTLSEIRGMPVVYQHQAPGEQIQALLQVHFVTDNVVTFIESVAIDFDELIKIADALIAQIQEA